MLRKLLRKLGATRTTLIVTAAAMVVSVLLYVMLGGPVEGRVRTSGIVISIIIPSVVTPLCSLLFLQLLFKLDLTERALSEANAELESRVKQRTAELLKANEALQAEITERKRAEGQIRASLREKEVLLKEIHHRVKNNLQVISSLLYLQAKNVGDEQALAVLQDSQSRVRAMVLVHERLYQSPDLARIDFAEYVRNLANYLFRSYGVNTNVIQLRLNVGDVLLGVDTAIPCGLIINELVSNSLKHAFPAGREGEIRIKLRSDDEGECILMVGDNGVGFAEGLDFRDAGTLGLELVNTLVAQLEGTVELDRSRGTTFKITFAELRQRKEGSHG